LEVEEEEEEGRQRTCVVSHTWKMDG